jgi:hypothetical protein
MRMPFLIIMTFPVILGFLFSTRSEAQERNNQAVPEPVQIYKDLRNRIFTSTPEELGFTKQGSASNVYGILMEMGFPKAVVTLVSLRDGTASLYVGTGGGVIGGGEHENVRRAAIDFVSQSEKNLAQMKKTDTFPYPAVGRVRFYVLTFDGVFTTEASESEVGTGKHNLSLLAQAGNEVLTQLRIVSEEKK